MDTRSGQALMPVWLAHPLGRSLSESPGSFVLGGSSTKNLEALAWAGMQMFEGF
jgi:hypothetical protein